MRRTERLFAIAEYLRGRRSGTTAQHLAEHFEVTVRTMYRDLSSLQNADLPVRADRGRGGGYALDRSYSLPPVNFNAREAALLLSAGQFLEQMRVIPFVETLRSALDKVRSALSHSAQRELIERLKSLQYVGVPAPVTSPAVRRAVERAWFEQCPLDIQYCARGITSKRTVTIRQIVMDRSVTLLNCDDLDLSQPRQFRLDRIVRAKACQN